MSPEPLPPLSQGETTWHELECQVESLAALAEQGIEPGEFYRALLERAASLLGARDGVVWRVTPSQRQRIAEYANSDLRLNSGPLRTISSQVQVREGTEDRIELNVDADLPTNSATNMLNVLRDVAVQYHRDRELAELRTEQQSRRGFEQILLRMHASLDPSATAFALANDGRAWLGCDRFSVIQMRGRRAKVLAVSGVDEIDARGEQIQRLERLASAVARTGEALTWSAGEAAELAPQLSALLEAYVDRSHAVALSMVPLLTPAGENSNAPRGVLGMLVAERFVETPEGDMLPQRLRALVPHAESALAAALAHHRVPLLKVQLALGNCLTKARQRPVSMFLLTGLIIAAIGSLIWIPADFNVEATGTLQPELRRHLFAPLDGVVEELLVEHGQQVKLDEPLLRLRNPELALELSRVAGELQTAQARWATVRAQRSSPNLEPGAANDERQLAAEEEQLREQIAGLETQQQVLRSSLADLQVSSPLAGVVLTWNLSDRLLNRPVKRGQKLLTVADPSSPWTVELQIPDRDAGHVLAARKADPELRVALQLGSDAATTRYGRVVSISQAAESTAGEPTQVIVTAQLDEPPSVEALAGASVAGRIHCGRRSLGYVWLHDLIDAARRKLWW